MNASARRALQPLLLGGIITRQALIAAGLDRDVGTREVTAGRWLRLAPGVYLASKGPATEDQRRLAALIHAGEGAVLAGPEAAGLHQARWVPHRDVVDALVAHERRVAECAGMEVHRTRHWPATTTRTGWPVVGAVDAVLQSARWARSLRDARGVVLGAVHDRLCRVEDLQEGLTRGGNHGPWSRPRGPSRTRCAAPGPRPRPRPSTC